MAGILDNLNGREILLASASPRRQELLGMLGIEFSVATLGYVDESYPHDLAADEVARYISRKKSDAYRATLHDHQLLITADTVVINDGHVLGKPQDATMAKQMLKSLSGKEHHVTTGVTLATKERQVTFDAVTHVTFGNLSDAEIDYYVEHFRPLDKAGAYGIQEWIGAVAVKAINGSYYNVMGLPLNRLYNELKKF